MIVLCLIGKICHMGLVLISHSHHMGNRSQVEAVCLHFTYLGSANQDDSTVSHREDMSHGSSIDITCMSHGQWKPNRSCVSAFYLPRISKSR